MLGEDHCESDLAWNRSYVKILGSVYSTGRKVILAYLYCEREKVVSSVMGRSVCH